jgi:hypothetical protein
VSRNRTPRSPYAKYAKAPYKYSEAYNHWRSASSEEGRAEADAAFRRIHNVPTWRIDPSTGHVINFKNVREGQRHTAAATTT